MKAGRDSPISKDCTIVTTSTEIANKNNVSNKYNTFESLDMLDKTLRASNLLSLTDGSRKKPIETAQSVSGYTAEAILDAIDADNMSSYIVIAEDNCYAYYAERLRLCSCCP